MKSGVWYLGMFSKSACLFRWGWERGVQKEKKPTPHLLQPKDAYLLCGFYSPNSSSRSELGREANQITAEITARCAKMPQGFRLGVNSFVLGAEEHSLMQDLMVCNSIKAVLQTVSGIGACVSLCRAPAQ